MKIHLFKILFLILIYKLVYSNPNCLPDTSKLDSMVCDGKSSFLKIIPAEKNRINGIGIKYWSPLTFKICDTLKVNGIYIDTNPIYSTLGALSTGMGIALLPFMYVQKIIQPQNHPNNTNVFKDSTFTIESSIKINGISLFLSNLEPFHNNGIIMGILGGQLADVNGLSITGFMHTFDEYRGISLALFANGTHILRGAFFAGLGNSVTDGKWFSFAGLYNESRRFVGIQVGLFNFCKDLTGFQFGLWNSNGKRSLPIFNWQF